jgi:hypothetical protein
MKIPTELIAAVGQQETFEIKREPPVIDGPVVQASSLSTDPAKDPLPPSRFHQEQSDGLRH